MLLYLVFFSMDSILYLLYPMNERPSLSPSAPLTSAAGGQQQHVPGADVAAQPACGGGQGEVRAVQRPPEDRVHESRAVRLSLHG